MLLQHRFCEFVNKSSPAVNFWVPMAFTGHLRDDRLRYAPSRLWCLRSYHHFVRRHGGVVLSECRPGFPADVASHLEHWKWLTRRACTEFQRDNGCHMADAEREKRHKAGC